MPVFGARAGDGFKGHELAKRMGGPQRDKKAEFLSINGVNCESDLPC